MANLHSLEALLNTIKGAYDLSALFDVNLNLEKRDLNCPDSITHYLLGFRNEFALSSRINYHNELGAVKYDVTVFYYTTGANNNAIHQLYIGTILSNEFYQKLEDADFFKDTDLFAIGISRANSVFPEIYVYSTI